MITKSKSFKQLVKGNVTSQHLVIMNIVRTRSFF